MGKKETTRGINIFYLTVFLGVFGTGLVLFFKFHVGDGSMRGMFLGVPKPVWLNIHRAMAIAFLTCFTIHIGLHWRYITNIAKRWRVGLPKRIKTTSRHQLLLLIESIVVIGIGFYTWIILSLSGSVYQSSELHHHLIDLHNIAGLFLLLSLTIHIKRRWHQVFRLKKNVPLNTKVITNSPDYSSRGSAIIFHNPFTRHTRTEYVQANIHKCKACGKCVEACKNSVLELIDILAHSHVHIRCAEKCRGCKKCIAVYPNAVFSELKWSHF